MVGSVLMDRMRAEGDFSAIEPVFFSTSDVGGTAPSVAGASRGKLVDAYDLDRLAELPAIVTCQGGDYTKQVYGPLRQRGWDGIWIDAASALRMDRESTIVLDPVNMHVIDQALAQGRRTFVGGNCTVSLMLMALHGLFAADQIAWVSSMTYQAASGAGAKNMRELLQQMRSIVGCCDDLLSDPAAAILDLDRTVSDHLRSDTVPSAAFGGVLAGSLLPWIDSDLGNGQSREEWKGRVETNRILGFAENTIPVEGICIRIGAMRCHSQALTIRLRSDLSASDIETTLAAANDWVEVIPNEKAATITALTPAAVTGTLSVPIGRIRRVDLGDGGYYMTAFTVGDQLLWGAAEPIRRMLRIWLDRSAGHAARTPVAAAAR